MLKGFILPVILVGILVLSGCATIMNGSRQPVGISSTPTKANITIDGHHFGETPLTAILTRKDHHLIRIELPGYFPYETTLVRKTSGWIAGNILFGGIIGLAVDAITGGMYKLTPEQIQTQLLTQTVSTFEKDNIYLFVTLEPDPEWELVHSLQVK